MLGLCALRYRDTVESSDDTDKPPVVDFVLGVGPMTSVKEQVAGVYAVALAVRGIAALAIDHRHYGESGGEPRQYEVPDHKIADIGGAIDWLADSPEVEANRLGLVGVCLGSS